MSSKRKPAGGAKDEGASAPSNGGKRTKQGSITAALQHKPSATLAPIVEVVLNPPPFLESRFAIELESPIQDYKIEWSRKSLIKSKSTEDVDLDAAGRRVVESVRRMLHHATHSGSILEPSVLDTLVLIIRNDVIHQYTKVARDAHALLMSYLASQPYVTVGYHPEGTPFAGKPYVMVSQTTAWLPHIEDRESFSSRYLMIADMALAGRNYHHDQHGGTAQKWEKEKRFSCAYDLLLHCFNGALRSAEVDCNGDLMLLRYMLTVLEQDLRARMKVFAAFSGNESDDDKVRGRQIAVLTSSLMWRIFTDYLVTAPMKQQMVSTLMAVMRNDREENLAEAEEEPEDDAPAGACVFTWPELAAMASKTLNMLLEMYGAAEAAGLFEASSRVRSSSANQRTLLDQAMLKAFMGEVCKSDDQRRTFLRSLQPRDALRFLGMFVAQKFKCTYGREAHGGLAETLLNSVHLLDLGNAAEVFIDVDMVAAVASINQDTSRMTVVYQSLDGVSMVVCGITLAAYAQAVAAGMDTVPCGKATPKELWQELKMALASIVSKANDSKGALSEASIIELALARMALAELLAW